MKKCKYATKSHIKGYTTCVIDGSIRKSKPKNCHCRKYELSWWQKFKDKFFN